MQARLSDEETTGEQAQGSYAEETPAGLVFVLRDVVMHWEPSSRNGCASGLRDVRLPWLWFFVAILIPLLTLEFPSPTRHTTKIAKPIAWLRTRLVCLLQ